MIIAGKSNEGKTFFVTNGLVKEALKNNMCVRYVVNNRHDVETDLAQQALKHKDIFVHPAKDLGKDTLKNLINIIKEHDQKTLIIYDNFTYSITPEFLDFCTIARKYNCSTVFITHTLYANAKISPRLREQVGYFVFFYLPASKTYKMILQDGLYETYKDEITPKSYKFMIIDYPNSVYSIGKLPDYKIDFKITDQKQTGKLASALKEINDNTHSLLEGTQKQTTQPRGLPVIDGLSVQLEPNKLQPKSKPRGKRNLPYKRI